MAEPFLEKSIHPTVIVRGYTRALEDAIKIVDRMAFPIDTNNRASMLNVVNSCIATKFTHRFGTLMAVSVGNAGTCLHIKACRLRLARQGLCVKACMPRLICAGLHFRSLQARVAATNSDISVNWFRH